MRPTTCRMPVVWRSTLGVALDVVSIDAGRMAGDLERMVAQLDEPLADPAPLNVLYISQLAREQGIKVLLSGAGLDGDARLVHYFRWVSESRLRALYAPAFRARLGNAHAIAPMLEFLRPLSTQAEPLESISLPVFPSSINSAARSARGC